MASNGEIGPPWAEDQKLARAAIELCRIVPVMCAGALAVLVIAALALSWQAGGGWAATGENAEALVAAEGVDLEPANDPHAVVPVASAVGPSAPVFAVENRAGSNRAFSGLNQGPGRTPWYGVDAPEAKKQEQQTP